jgi:hypothetical protein
VHILGIEITKLALVLALAALAAAAFFTIFRAVGGLMCQNFRLSAGKTYEAPVTGRAPQDIVVLVLRSVFRRVSGEELRAAWPGTDDGFAALRGLVRPRATDRAEVAAGAALSAMA